MDQWSALGQCLAGVKHSGERLVLDVDPLARGARCVQSICGHRRHRLALIASDSTSEDRLILHVQAQSVVKVLSHKDGAHPSNITSPRRVGVHNSCRRMWRRQHRGVEHPRQGKVVHELCGSGHLVPCILTRKRLSHGCEFFAVVRYHRNPPAIAQPGGRQR